MNLRGSCMKLMFDNEYDARVYVRSLRLFYQELRVSLMVTVLLTLIWIFGGASYFWPLWFAMGWGASLLFRGFKLGILDTFWLERVCGIRICALNDHWEDQKVRDLLNMHAQKHKAGALEGPSGQDKQKKSKKR